LTFTFSRGAWIGAAAAIALTAVLAAPAVWRKLSLVIAGVLALIVVLSIPLLLKAPGPLQYIILHASIANHSQANLSDSQHAISLRSGFESIIRAPFGHGLGTAGPSTFHEGIPNIIENFYLQVGYEIGLAGVVVFIALIALMLIKLKACIRTNELALPAIAAILGISIVAVVLPSWVDSSTSLIVWIAAGAVTGLEYV
jgi:O-antigen ligase